MDIDDIQTFSILDRNRRIRTVTIMKDSQNKECYRKTSTGRWIRCGKAFVRRVARDQKRLVRFMKNSRHLLDIDISSHDSSSASEEDKGDFGLYL